MSTLRFGKKSAPVALLIACLLSFGLLIPWLGFFWDDWPAIWYLHVFGPAGFGDVFAVDRPLLGRLFSITTPLFGSSIIAWQSFGIITRWLASLAFLLFVRSLWPDKVRQGTIAALLFAVYPGFKQQYISVTYSHVWLVAGAFLLSFALMIWALRVTRGRLPLMLGSWLLSAFSLFTVEYFFGVELLRPLLIWLVLSGQIEHWSRRLLKTLLVWLPYLALILIFLYWRLMVFPSPRADVHFVDKLVSNPLSTLLDFGKNLIADSFNASFGAWAQAANVIRLTSYGSGPTLFYLAGLVISIALAVFYLRKFNPSPGTPDNRLTDKRWSWQSISLGLAGLFLGGIPFWFTNLPIGLDFPWDRFTLAMMVGASLLVVGLIELVARTPLQKMIILGLAVGLAAGMHLQYSNLFRREWNSQSQFFWQLVWRAPGIQPGTLLLTAELPFIYFSDNSLTAPLNWTYAPDLNTTDMSYMLYTAEARHEVSLTDFKPGISVTQPYRATQFNGTTSQALVLFYTPPGCLKILDPDIDKRMPQKPKFISDMMPLSKPALVFSDQNPPASPPLNIFGEEPEHGWCYYFEKADLARQVGDWRLAAEMGDNALALDHRLYEVNASELVTFIEAYAHTGQMEKAFQLTRRTMDLNNRMGRMLCDAWIRIADSIPPANETTTTMAQLQQELDCTPP